MTKAELISKLAEEAGVTKTQADAVLSSLGATVTDTLKQGGKITVPGIGIFSVGERAAREGRNPQTGATIKIAAAKTVKYKAPKSLKDSVNQ